MALPKFRAWDKELKRMRTVSKIEFVAKYIIVRDPPEVGVELREGEFELMRFVGLKDKNGVDIYELDIVKFPDGMQCLVEVGYFYNSDYEDQWSGIGWNVNLQDVTDCVVIGNKFQEDNKL